MHHQNSTLERARFDIASKRAKGVDALRKAMKWVTEGDGRFSGGARHVRQMLRAMTGANAGQCNVYALICLLDDERSKWVADIMGAAMNCRHPSELWMAIGFQGNFPEQRALEVLNDTDPDWSTHCGGP